MADETLWGTHKLWTPILNGLNLTEDDFEEVRLSIGGNTALVGDLVTYIGQVTAATPTTHRDVKLAVAVSSDDQTAADPNGWCGQIIEPVIKPDPISGVEWVPSTALIDGTMVRILKRGARATTAMIYTDASDDVLPGNSLSVSATGGEIRKSVNAYTDTTPTVNELANALISQGLEHVGYADGVAEDSAGNAILVAVNWGR